MFTLALLFVHQELVELLLLVAPESAVFAVFGSSRRPLGGGSEWIVRSLVMDGVADFAGGLRISPRSGNYYSRQTSVEVGILRKICGPPSAAGAAPKFAVPCTSCLHHYSFIIRKCFRQTFCLLRCVYLQCELISETI